MKRILGAILATLALTACGADAEPAPPAPGSSPAEPSTVEITCHQDGSTELGTPSVAARSEGLHIRVNNDAGESVSVNGLGWDFDPGVSEATLSVPPGRTDIACWPYSEHEGPEPETVPLEVTDPEGHWLPAELECAKGGMISESISDFVAGSPGEQGDPVDIVRRHVRGLEPDDTVERASYPDQKDPVVRIVRQGKVIGVGRLTATDQGGYLFGSFGSCDEEGLRQE